MKESHPNMYFNNIPVSSTSLYKHIGLLVDDKLSYEHHLKFVVNKVKKTINLLCKFQQNFRRQSLITIYKLFIQSHLNYDRAFNEQFHKNP